MANDDQKRNGGPAFPQSETLIEDDAMLVKTAHGGMTLRQYYAGQALVGMLAHPTRYKPRDGRADWHSAIAEEAHEIADAMIAVGGAR